MSKKAPLLLAFDLEHCSQDTTARLINDPATDGALLDRIVRLYYRDLPLMEALVLHPKVFPPTLVFLYQHSSPEFQTKIKKLKSEPGKSLVPSDGRGVADPGMDGSFQETTGGDSPSLYRRIQTMTVAEKVQFALKAGKEARNLLLKDPNRQVSGAVLNSPKITEDEILLIAQSRNVSDEILRMVGTKKEWLKNYAVVLALASNPKTPLGISMPLLPSIKMKDLSMMAKNRNLPEAIRTGANRLVLARQKQG